jgi:UDP-N-acetylmuramoyl-L-alanyl-D-glutamate--2,6-diaminopimelate ligase
VTINEVVQATGAKLIGESSIPVMDVTHDSRQAGRGSLFVAVRGELFDAHKFVPQVIEQGAAGVLSEHEPPENWHSLAESQSGRGLAPATWLQVENVRRAMAVAAAAVHHHPSKELQLVGINGTNGKNTTA